MKILTNNDEINENDFYLKLKNKKNPKIINKDELSEIKIIKRENKNYNEKRLKRFLFNYNKYELPPISSISQKNLLDNNSILIRPNILSSAKQIQYEKEKTDLNEDYLQLLIQRLLPQNNNEKIVIEKRKEDFYNYIDKIKLLKIKEKLKIEKKEYNIEEEDNSFKKITIKKEKKKDNYKNTRIQENKRKSCLLIFYEKLWNFCLKSPMDPYSSKKKIWAGKNGIFKEQFQDNRIFNK